MKKFKIKEKEKKKKNEGDVSPFTYSSNNKSLWKRSQSTVDVPSQNNISMEHNPKIKQVLNHSLSSKGRRSRKTK